MSKKTLSIGIDIDGREPVKFSISSMQHAGTLYEREVSELFCRWLRPGDCVIDVGANIGWFTILSASIVGPTGKVFAYEPGGENLKTLKENAALNELSNIEFHEVALSDQRRSRDFFLNPEGHGGHSLWKMIPEAIPQTVTTETLDDQYLPARIRILKIDTEGHEQRILVGAKRILEGEQAPDFIFAEYHHTGLAAEGDTEHSLRMLMAKHGYLSFLLPPHSYLPIMLGAGVVIQSQYAVNYLFVREAQLAEMPQFIEAGWLEVATANEER